MPPDLPLLPRFIKSVAKLRHRQNSAATDIGARQRINWVDTASAAFTVTESDVNEEVLVSLATLGAPPTGTAGGTLGGTYPNPTVNTGSGLETSANAVRIATGAAGTGLTGGGGAALSIATKGVTTAMLAAGPVLQVGVGGTGAMQSSSSTTFVDVTGLTVTITPRATTSTILVMVTGLFTSDTDDFFLNVVRDSTNIFQGASGSTSNQSAFGRMISNVTPQHIAVNGIDSPATTSTTTYKVQYRTRTGNVYCNRRATDTAYSAWSSITVMEIAGA